MGASQNIIIRSETSSETSVILSTNVTDLIYGPCHIYPSTSVRLLQLSRSRYQRVAWLPVTAPGGYGREGGVATGGRPSTVSRSGSALTAGPGGSIGGSVTPAGLVGRDRTLVCVQLARYPWVHGRQEGGGRCHVLCIRKGASCSYYSVL